MEQTFHKSGGWLPEAKELVKGEVVNWIECQLEILYNERSHVQKRLYSQHNSTANFKIVKIVNNSDIL